jgi:uncharacterized protein involved in type VI secretion and phage assembly
MIGDDLMRTLLAPPDADGRFFGVVVGVVTNNRDPDSMHRVKVRFPWLDTEHESHWARVATAMAGNGRGSYFLPEVDDEVLVAFEHGSLEHPFVIGALWNGKDSPPEKNSDGRNDNRTIKSRSGHVIRLFDGSGGERIDIIDKTGENKIVITSSDNRIAIQAQGDIEIKSQTGTVKISGVSIEISATTGVKVQANTTLDASGSAEVNITGGLVNINS